MPEHYQSCFDVQTQRCVCPIGDKEARLKSLAPRMEALLRRIIMNADGGGECPVCRGFDATVPEKEIRSLIKELDEPIRSQT